MSMLREMWEMYAKYSEEPIDWFTNPWGWPTVFGIGAAEHPVDPSHDMIWINAPGLTTTVWDERLQLEYSI